MTTIRIAESSQDRDACFLIRKTVFVDEQQVPLDMEYDEHDETALHLLVLEGTRPVGTARVLFGPDGKTARSGRVAIDAARRGQGLGRRLMIAIEDASACRAVERFVLDAQAGALPFYESLGYVAQGPEFIEAGIVHRTMGKQRQGDTSLAIETPAVA
ncbi:GNAT family N-acetyltransferase [Gluconacetobacter diazotrophicus]|nr:GNAT family N-acetyltransferase [Gluconacetobacter diazotrophicus]